MNPLTRKTMGFIAVFLVLFSLCPSSILASPVSSWQGYKDVEELPEIDTIPDPFQFFDVRNDPNGDGVVSTPAEWENRRQEIRELVQRYWLGYRWETPEESVTGATYPTYEPNEIALGFDWPPFFYATRYNLGEEFQKLADRLLEETVEVREITNAGLGDVVASAGPASDADEAQAMAIELWNAGYALPYVFFGVTSYAKLVDYTGPITEPPGLTRPVTYYQVTVEREETNASETFRIYLMLPDAAQRLQAWGDANAAVPVVIDIGSTLSAAQVQVLNEQGYGYVRFNPTDIYADSQSQNPNRDGLYTRLYPYNKDEYEYASGALMAWGWAVSQIITALSRPTEYDPESTWGEELRIDPTRTLVTGHSRYGKSAIFAAAFDDRIGIVLASEPGGSGIQSYRYKVEGKIFNFNVYPKADRVYGKTEIPTVSYGGGTSWFPENAGQFVNKDNRLPFDSSDIVALIAPRPFLATTGIDAHWLGNEGAVAAIQAAAEVYEYIGSNDTERYNIAIRARQSDHLLYNRDLPFMISIMDREFKQGPEDQVLHVQDLFPAGSDTLGNISYPARDYANVSDMTSHPFDINSSYLPWSHPNKYTLWTKQENILTGYPAVIEAHSDAPSVVLILPDKRQIVGESAGDGRFIFRLSGDQTLYGRYELRTAGADKANKSVFFSAVSLADALRHATSKGDEGEENRLIGFSSRLANDRNDPPIILVDGQPVTLSFTPERFKEEETTLLEYGIQFHDKLFARIATEGWDASKAFHIRNLKFVSIQGFTFEISFGNIYASAGNNGKDGASLFTQPISWNVERYNNGPAPVWPEIPDNLAEKQALLNGEEIIRESIREWGDQVEVRVTGPALEVILHRSSEDGKSEEIDSFDVPVTLSIPVPEGADPDLLGIYLITKDGDLVYVGGELRDGMLVVKMSRPGRYVLLEYERSYSDVSDEHWAYKAIRIASARHLMNGLPDGSFAPGDAMTRAQLVAIITRAMKLQASGGTPFQDVEPGSWYAEAIAAAYEAGIVNGKAPELFGPNDTITREEAAVMLVRAYEKLFGEIKVTSGYAYKDADQISPWAYEAVMKARELGLMVGKGADRFDPQDLVTRAEGAQLIVNFLSLLIS